MAFLFLANSAHRKPFVALSYLINKLAMRYLFDIGHPAHVHYFRNAIRILQSRGHEVSITTRDKEISLYLLDKLGFQYTCRGKNLVSVLGKALSIIRNDASISRYLTVAMGIRA
jgi:predicted glycosyltransferase